MSVTNLKLNLQRLHTMRTWSVSIRSIRALRSAVFLVCYKSDKHFHRNLSLANKFLHMLHLLSCCKISNRVWKPDSPADVPPFKKLAVFLCPGHLETKTSLLDIARTIFGVSGGEPRARRPCDRSSNPLDAPFLFGNGKGENSLFQRRAMS